MDAIQITLRSEKGHSINCCLKSADNEKPSPLVIFVHGFKGFMNWGGFPYFTTRLSEYGYSVLSFDFSMNGVSSQTPADFSRLDLFAENTISAELSELKLILDHFFENSEKYKIDKDRICLIGHSRGGGTAILGASEDSRIKVLITLAAVSTFDRYTDSQKKKWYEKGFIEIPNSRTGQIMKMNSSFLKDIELNSSRLNIMQAIGRLNIPVLLIHGKEDLAVKYTEALELFESSEKSGTELYIIENTGHTFGIEHPFKGTTEPFENVIKKITEFLNKDL